MYMNGILDWCMYSQYLDHKVFSEFLYFLQRVNERTEFKFGLRESYVEKEDEPELGINVEYFGFNILQDDRMRYIIENIIDSNLSETNKIGNTIISHFYGARGVHTSLTGISDPKKAFVDFDRLSENDTNYLSELKTAVEISKKKKLKFYGTTELHTSLQTAGRNFCRKKYNNSNRIASTLDIVEMISGWKQEGFLDEIINSANTLEKMFKLLSSKPGIGEYYGYHCSTSNSVNPALPFDHDEPYCVPGPGARESINLMFSRFKGKLPYGKIVVWLRENEHLLFKPLKIHNHFHNFKLNDQNLFYNSQDTMKVYGTEVALCQFSVYNHLKKNPHLISRRVVARNDDDSVCDGQFLIDGVFS